WLLKQWSFLMSPAGIQMFGIQPFTLPSLKHAGALSLADGDRATTPSILGSRDTFKLAKKVWGKGGERDSYEYVHAGGQSTVPGNE
ncbi:unnamed protein product, partial [Bubo scandiacus]